MSPRHPRRGAQAVEFAVLLPILLVLFSGTVDLFQHASVALHVVEAVADGAQTGALVAVTSNTSPITTANSVAKSAYAASGSPGTLTATSVLKVVGSNTLLTVTGSVAYTPWFGLIQLPNRISSSSTMRLAYP